MNGTRAERGLGRGGEGQRGGTSPGHAAAELKSALRPPKVSSSLRSEAVGDSPSAPHSLQEVGRGRDAGGPTLTPKTQSSQLCRHAPLSALSAAQGLQQQSYPGAAPGPTRGFERCRGHTSRVVPGLPSPNMERGPGRGPRCRWRFGPKIAAPPPVSYPPSSHRGEAKRGPGASADPAALSGGQWGPEVSKRPGRAHCPHTPHPRAARLPHPYQCLHSVYTGAQAPHPRPCAAGRTPRADPCVPCGAHRGSLPRCSPARRDHADGPGTFPESTQLLPPTHSRDMTPAAGAQRA